MDMIWMDMIWIYIYIYIWIALVVLAVCAVLVVLIVLVDIVVLSVLVLVALVCVLLVLLLFSLLCVLLLCRCSVAAVVGDVTVVGIPPCCYSAVVFVVAVFSDGVFGRPVLQDDDPLQVGHSEVEGLA